VVQGEAATELAALPSGAAEVVVFDPMFDVPAQAAQGFDLLRRVARHGPPDSVALREAARVASRRLVIKVRKDAVAPALPDDLPASLRVPGKAVDYVVVDTREHQRRFVLLVP
jgi:hypothetical protein